MRYRLWNGTDRRVPIIGQGTWMLEGAGRTRAVATLRRGLDLGMTHIDTAEMYGNGDAEIIVGEAITGRRHEVFLVSKVLPENASRRGAIVACERSLARLKTDRLDAYLLHWRGRHPLEETVGAFEDLQRDGKILSWGVSNFDTSDLDELTQLGTRTKCTCNQVLYHLRERGIEHDVLPKCESLGISLVAYSPFGHSRPPSPRSREARVLEEIATRHAVTPAAVILAFLTRRASVFTIPKAASIEHVEANARAGDLELSAEEIARIDAAFPRGSRPASLPVI
jgi:diketogulonate reductase-like aldo/keto reductase